MKVQVGTYVAAENGITLYVIPETEIYGLPELQRKFQWVGFLRELELQAERGGEGMSTTAPTPNRCGCCGKEVSMMWIDASGIHRCAACHMKAATYGITATAKTPSDDGEPITREWWSELGDMTLNSVGTIQLRLEFVHDSMAEDANHGSARLVAENEYGDEAATLWLVVTTRGDLRRLLAALGYRREA